MSPSLTRPPPHSGGKYSGFEGGIRVTSWASGGYIPAARRGTVEDSLISVADWYGTIADVFGVPQSVWGNDTRAARGTAPRTELAVSSTALIIGHHKVLTGKQVFDGHTGVTYPNASSVAHPISAVRDCDKGCLFDVYADETEDNDLAATHPDLLATMLAKLAVWNEGAWTNADVGVDVCPAGTKGICACWAAVHVWGGWFGPYQK